MGNGGFSIRSRRLLQATADPLFARLEAPEDEAIGRLLRSYLELRYGIRFAPPGLADAFSIEHAPLAGRSLGFHGLFHFHRVFNDEELQEVMDLLEPSVYAGGNALLWFAAVARDGARRWLPVLATRILRAQSPQTLAANCRLYGFEASTIASALARAAA